MMRAFNGRCRKIIFLLMVISVGFLVADDTNQSVNNELNLTKQTHQEFTTRQFVEKWEDVKFPNIPNNFTWQILRNIDVAVITPNEWKQKLHKDEKNIKVFAFTGDKLDEHGFFETGLTVKVFLLNSIQGDNLVKIDFAIARIFQTIKMNSNNKIIFTKVNKQAPNPMFIFRYENSPPNMTPIIVHTTFIGDPYTGNVYEFIFESPKSVWNEKWKIGEQIFSRLLVLFTDKQSTK